MNEEDISKSNRADVKGIRIGDFHIFTAGLGTGKTIFPVIGRTKETMHLWKIKDET